MGRPLDEDIIIKILERWRKAFKENSHYVSASDLSLVIKDVRELPTIQPVATDTNVGDTISRQAAIDAAKDWYEGLICGSINGLIKRLNALPSAQPERKKGEWIRNDNGTYSCSVCQSWIPEEQHYYARYCLCCGADLRGKKDG